MALHHRVRPDDCPPVLLKPSHNVPLDTSQDVDNFPTEVIVEDTANTSRSAIPNTTPVDDSHQEIKNIKNQAEHAHLRRKEAVLEGRRYASSHLVTSNCLFVKMIHHSQKRAKTQRTSTSTNDIAANTYLSPRGVLFRF